MLQCECFPVYPPMFTPYRVLCYSWEINPNMRHDVLTLGCRLQIPYIEFFFFFFLLKVQTDAKWLLLAFGRMLLANYQASRPRPNIPLRRLITAKTSPPSLWSNPFTMPSKLRLINSVSNCQIQVAKVFNQFMTFCQFFLSIMIHDSLIPMAYESTSTEYFQWNEPTAHSE